jgi:hypothetical protein
MWGDVTETVAILPSSIGIFSVVEWGGNVFV